MSEYSYTVILHPEAEGGYSVFVPALPGCHTQGDTLEEALKNVEEAIALCLDVLKGSNHPIPTETPPMLKTVKVVA